MGGVKHDEGKPRMDLIPPEAVVAMGDVFHFGAEKYGERNWEKGIDPGRLFAAAQRHLWAWKAGKEVDEESGLPTLYHALASVAMLVALEDRRAAEDPNDLARKMEELDKKVEAHEAQMADSDVNRNEPPPGGFPAFHP